MDILNLKINIFSIPSSFKDQMDNELSSSQSEINELFTDILLKYNNYYNFKGIFYDYTFSNNLDNINTLMKVKIQNYLSELSNIKLNENFLNNLINYQKEIIDYKYNIIKNYINKVCSIYSNYKMSNHSISDINSLLIDNLNLLYSESQENILNFLQSKSYELFEYSIKNYIVELFNESSQSLLNILNKEKENLQRNISNMNTTIEGENINNLTELELLINIIFSDYYNNFTKIFSDSNILTVLNTNMNKSLNKFILPYSFDNLFDSFIKKLRDSLENLIKFNNNTFYYIIQNNFNQLVSDFNYYVGINIFDEFTNQYLNNISSHLDYIFNITNDTYIIDLTTELKNITSSLNDTLSLLYSNFKSNIIENYIESRIESVIFTKLNEQKNEIKEIIVRDFINLIIHTLSNEEFKLKVQGEIYNLIPLSFPDSFLNQLNQIFIESMNYKILSVIKERYNSTILEKVNYLKRLIDRKNQILNQKLGTLNIYSFNEFDNAYMNDYYNYLDTISKYSLELNESIDYQIQNDIKTMNKSFKEYIDKINEIVEKYHEGKVNSTIYLIQNMNEIETLNPSSIINPIKENYNDTITILETNIINESNNIFSILDNLGEEIMENITKQYSSKLRNLKEYNLIIIVNIIKDLESKILSFSQILNSNNYLSLSTINDNLKENIMNKINTLTLFQNYINYLDLNEKISYIYGIDCEYKISELYDILGNITVITEKSIVNIKKDINQLNEKILLILIDKIDKSLEVLPTLFNYLRKNSSIVNFQSFPNFELNHESKGITQISNLLYSYGYNYEFDDKTNVIIFDMYINATSFVNINNFLDFITENIKGELGDGAIHLKIKYPIFDDETIIEVYPSQNFTSYNTSFFIINYTDLFSEQEQFEEFNLSLINYIPKILNNKKLKLKNK